MKNQKLQADRIKQQFTLQAQQYTALPSHSEALDLLIEHAQVDASDLVLDLACGSGIVACAFAEKAREVVGIDMTPAMLEEAEKLKLKYGLTNIKWDLGDVNTLPYSSNSFDIVVSRFGFHHFLQPALVLNEMKRVCKSNGEMIVVDVVLPEDKQKAYNEMERLRDPSHVEALNHSQYMRLFESLDLRVEKSISYTMQISFNDQQSASFPPDPDQWNRLVLADEGVDKLGVQIQKIGQELYLHYPIEIFVLRRPKM